VKFGDVIQQLKKTARDQWKSNLAFILRLDKGNKLKLSFQARNKALLEQMLKFLNSLSPEVQECIENDYCVTVSVNTLILKKYRKTIEQIYKLSQEIQRQPLAYGKPGGKCSGSIEECKKRVRNANQYIKWLKREINRLKKLNLTLTSKIPIKTTKCE